MKKSIKNGTDKQSEDQEGRLVGIAHATIKAIAERAGCSENEVLKSLKKLETLGFVTPAQTPDTYILTPDGKGY